MHGRGEWLHVGPDVACPPTQARQHMTPFCSVERIDPAASGSKPQAPLKYHVTFRSVSHAHWRFVRSSEASLQASWEAALQTCSNDTKGVGRKPHKPHQTITTWAAQLPALQQHAQPGQVLHHGAVWPAAGPGCAQPPTRRQPAWSPMTTPSGCYASHTLD